MENKIKNMLIDNICYTDLVYGRINKKLSVAMTRPEIEQLILKVISDKSSVIEKKGKNYYVCNHTLGKSITINSNTFRVITVSRI